MPLKNKIVMVFATVSWFRQLDNVKKRRVIISQKFRQLISDDNRRMITHTNQSTNSVNLNTTFFGKPLRIHKCIVSRFIVMSPTK